MTTMSLEFRTMRIAVRVPLGPVLTPRLAPFAGTLCMLADLRRGYRERFAVGQARFGDS